MHTCHWALNDPELARETLVLHPSGIIMVDDVFKKRGWAGSCSASATFSPHTGIRTYPFVCVGRRNKYFIALNGAASRYQDALKRDCGAACRVNKTAGPWNPKTHGDLLNVEHLTYAT